MNFWIDTLIFKHLFSPCSTFWWIFLTLSSQSFYWFLKKNLSYIFISRISFLFSEFFFCVTSCCWFIDTTYSHHSEGSNYIFKNVKFSSALCIVFFFFKFLFVCLDIFVHINKNVFPDIAWLSIHIEEQEIQKSQSSVFSITPLSTTLDNSASCTFFGVWQNKLTFFL